MRSLLSLLTVALLSLLCTAVSQAAAPGCGSMQFSEAVLAKFPGAPRACLDVISRDGEAYGVFKAKIMRVHDAGNAIDLRFRLPDGSYSDTRKLKTNPALRVLVQGKPRAVSELAVGDELSAYVKVRTPMMALQPAEPTTEPQFTDIPPPVLPVPEAPATAATPSRN